MKKNIKKNFKAIEILEPGNLIFIKHPNDVLYDENKDPHAHDHVLNLTRGIYLMEDWWRSRNVRVDYHITDHNQYYLEGMKELAKYVRKIHHEVAPHQMIDESTLVFGVGATQVLHAAIYALSVLHATSSSHKHFLKTPPLYFTHQTPGYLDSKFLIESFGEFNAHWVDFEDHEQIDRNNLVEIITNPNNPDARALVPKTHAKYRIHDRVNLWPFFTTQNHFYKETLEEDLVSVFSLAKLLSFSGSRVGYAFVKDQRIAQIMKYFIMRETHGVSVDGELRCLIALRYLTTHRQIHHYIEWVSKKFAERWGILKKAMKKNPEIELLNQYGANIWLRTPYKAEKYLYSRYRIRATYGDEYGVDDTYARLNMQCTNKQFEELIWRLNHL